MLWMPLAFGKDPNLMRVETYWPARVQVPLSSGRGLLELLLTP